VVVTGPQPPPPAASRKPPINPTGATPFGAFGSSGVRLNASTTTNTPIAKRYTETIGLMIGIGRYETSNAPAMPPMTPAGARRQTNFQSTFRRHACVAPDTPVEKISAVCTAALAAA